MVELTTSTAFLGNALGELSSWSNDDLIAPLLILVLGMALGIGAICLVLVAHFLRQGQAQSRPSFWAKESRAKPRRPARSLYHAPERWLAIRSRNLKLIQTTLGLQHLTPCSWEEGLHAAQDQKLFVSPPLRGWVLVMGTSLPDPSEDVDRCFRMIHSLSLKLGQVQFFNLNRAVNHHAWVLADHGRISRGYAWADQTLWNQGRMTREEIDLGMTCYDYDAPESNGEFDFRQSAPAAVNTEKLPSLAGRWSIDPTLIDGRWMEEALGMAGEASSTIVY